MKTSIFAEVIINDQMAEILCEANKLREYCKLVEEQASNMERMCRNVYDCEVNMTAEKGSHKK